VNHHPPQGLKAHLQGVARGAGGGGGGGGGGGVMLAVRQGSNPAAWRVCTTWLSTRARAFVRVLFWGQGAGGAPKPSAVLTVTTHWECLRAHAGHFDEVAG